MVCSLPLLQVPGSVMQHSTSAPFLSSSAAAAPQQAQSSGHNECTEQRLLHPTAVDRIPSAWGAQFVPPSGPALPCSFLLLNPWRSGATHPLSASQPVSPGLSCLTDPLRRVAAAPLEASPPCQWPPPAMLSYTAIVREACSPCLMTLPHLGSSGTCFQLGSRGLIPFTLSSFR